MPCRTTVLALTGQNLRVTEGSESQRISEIENSFLYNPYTLISSKKRDQKGITRGQDSTVQYSTVQDSTGQDSTVQYRTGQDSTVKDSTVQYSTGGFTHLPLINLLN